jgi:hypothetical protein
MTGSSETGEIDLSFDLCFIKLSYVKKLNEIRSMICCKTLKIYYNVCVIYYFF